MRYLLHIIGWLLILVLPYFFSVHGAVDLRHVMDNQHELNNLLNYSLLIAFSYINYLVLVPRFYLKRKYWQYFAIVTGCLLVIVFLPEGFDNQAWPGPPPPPAEFGPRGHWRNPPPPPFFLEKSAIMLLFFVSIVVSISVQINNYLQKAEKGQLNAELSYLKMQLHPHFLFNALNTIYALAIRKDDETPDAVLKLSELMRYVIRDSAHHKVPLDKELAYIGNYISLQRSGLGGTVSLDYHTEGDPGNLLIAPLILIPFIENAFKHGVNPDEDGDILVQVRVGRDKLDLLVSNKRLSVVHKDEGGIGMANARERLQLLYPSRHVLKVTDTGERYIVELAITLT